MLRDRGNKVVLRAITAIGPLRGPMGGINDAERRRRYYAALIHGRGAR